MSYLGEMSEGQRGAPPPHGQVSPPADSPLLAQAGLIAKSPPNPTIQPRTSHPKLSLSYLPAGCFARGDVRRTEGVPSPAWTGLPASRLPSPHPRPPPHGTGLTASRLPSLHTRPPPHGQVSPPADSSLPTSALPRMDRSHRQQTPLSIAPPNPFPSASP